MAFTGNRVAGLAVVDRAGLPDGDEEQRGLRIIGRGSEVSRALRVGTGVGSFGRRVRAGLHDGMAMIVETRSPSLMRKRFPVEELARLAVEHIVKRVAIGLD